MIELTENRECVHFFCIIGEFAFIWSMFETRCHLEVKGYTVSAGGAKKAPRRRSKATTRKVHDGSTFRNKKKPGLFSRDGLNTLKTIQKNKILYHVLSEHV